MSCLLFCRKLSKMIWNSFSLNLAGLRPFFACTLPSAPLVPDLVRVSLGVPPPCPLTALRLSTLDCDDPRPPRGDSTPPSLMERFEPCLEIVCASRLSFTDLRFSTALWSPDFLASFSSFSRRFLASFSSLAFFFSSSFFRFSSSFFLFSSSFCFCLSAFFSSFVSLRLSFEGRPSIGLLLLYISNRYHSPPFGRPPLLRSLTCYK